MSRNPEQTFLSRSKRSTFFQTLCLLFFTAGSLFAQPTYDVNINCGGAAYVTAGGVSFSADSLFNNGLTFSNFVDPVAATTDDILYQTERYDANLSYSFNVPISGVYDVTLHFAEVFFNNQASGKREFDLSLEGNLVLDDYDIYASVGGYTAEIQNFQVTVNDGVLNITSTSSINKAKLCAIQVKYNPPVCNDPNHVATVDNVSKSICSTDSIFLEGAYRMSAGVYTDTLLNQNACDSIVITTLQIVTCSAPTFDFGINCGGISYTSTTGFVFSQDVYSVNGSVSSNLNLAIANTPDPVLYQTERYNAILAYNIPVPANGEYIVELHFAETFVNNFQPGKRVFDIALENIIVLDDYDIYNEVGSNTAAVKTSKIDVQDGVLSLTSTSSVNNAKLCAIRITSAPVDCQLGAWSPWSACDVSCGGGQQFRTRPVLVAAANGGIPCGPIIEYRACNTQPCPVDCQVSAWSAWSACDVSCGGGQQFRTRTVITPAANGGVTCPNLIEYRACNTQLCPVDCQVSVWSPWSACDVSCGGGQQSRTRTVIIPAANGGVTCPNLIEYRACNIQPCPVDCQVSAWSAWSACDVSCGGGQQSRTRTITTPAANGGVTCPNLIEYRVCNTQVCVQNGQCPKDTIVSTSATTCDEVVHFNLDRSGISSSFASVAYQNVPQNLTDCPKNSNYGLSVINLTPSGVSGTATGTDTHLESVYLKIDHKRISDLVIDLVSPNGTVVRLMERPGNANLWGNGGCDKDDMDAYFVPGTGNSAENDCSGNKPVLSGSYTAHDGFDLASLNDGSSPNGQWTLKVYDLRNKKKPKLRAWSLEFRSSMGSIIQIAGLPSGSTFPLGITTNTMVFTDSTGNVETCSFNVTVEDNTPPDFDACPQDVLVCGDPITWTAPTATDNCSPVVVTQLTGPTMGSSLADGTYPISYQAVDASGNVSTCSFDLVKGLLSVDAGNDKVIYTGGASGCALLYSSVQNGQWPYTYSWSSGSTGPASIVCPTATTDYILTVTDANGCSGTDTVRVEVVNVSCGKKKVLVCYNNTTYCVKSWVAWYYTSYMGASYGSCSQSTAKKMGDPSNLRVVPPSDAPVSFDMLQAYPNPFDSYTSIGWQFAEGETVEVGLYDLTGRLIREIYKGQNIPGEYQTLDFDSGNLPDGIYLVIAKTEYNTKTLRINHK